MRIRNQLQSADGGSDRGVSDLVAFVLTFSIIVTSVAVVSMFGLGALEDAGDGARADSAEAAMVGFHDSIDDLRTTQVPRRTTELQLNSDTIRTNDTEIRVEIAGTAGGHISETVDVGSLARETGQDATIVYESGAVYREERRGQVGVRTPSFRCGPDTAHVALVKLTGDADFASNNAVTLSAERTDSYPVYPDPGAGQNGVTDSVNVDLSGTHNQDAWNQTFDRRFKEWDKSGDSYECDDVDRVYFHVTEVELTVVR